MDLALVDSENGRVLKILQLGIDEHHLDNPAVLARVRGDVVSAMVAGVEHHPDRVALAVDLHETFYRARRAYRRRYHEAKKTEGPRHAGTGRNTQRDRRPAAARSL